MLRCEISTGAPVFPTAAPPTIHSCALPRPATCVRAARDHAAACARWRRSAPDPPCPDATSALARARRLSGRMASARVARHSAAVARQTAPLRPALRVLGCAGPRLALRCAPGTDGARGRAHARAGSARPSLADGAVEPDCSPLVRASSVTPADGAWWRTASSAPRPTCGHGRCVCALVLRPRRGAAAADGAASSGRRMALRPARRADGWGRPARGVSRSDARRPCAWRARKGGGRRCRSRLPSAGTAPCCR